MTYALPPDEFELDGPLPLKAALFALPVIIHNQLSEERFPADPALPGYELILGGLAKSLEGDDGAQDVMVLDRLMSPSWLANACARGNEVDAATRLVLGHYRESMDLCFDLNSLIEDTGIQQSKSLLGFIVGAVFRRDEDPTPLTLVDPQLWETNPLRHTIERAISVGPLLLRHQVMPPLPADEALIAGFEGLCGRYMAWMDSEPHVTASFTGRSIVTLDVRCSERQHEFVLDVTTMPTHRIERLLNRLEKMRTKRSHLGFAQPMDVTGRPVCH